MLKRLLSVLLAVLMLLSLVGCGSSTDSPQAKGGYYKVCGVYYSEELGAPVLGEAAKELELSDAAEQITNVGDALYYISVVGAEKSSTDIVTLFVDLVNYDYDDVGTIKLTRMDSGETHTLVYVKSGESYYPFDPCCMKHSDFLESKKARAADSDLNSLGKRLASYYPRPNGVRAEYDTQSMSSYSKEEYAIIKHITTPQYTEEQIKQWVADGLTLDEWAEKITVPADALQLLWAINYREKDYNDNSGFFDENSAINWVGIWNAQTVFDYRSGGCGGTSVIMNYLLSGDFDDQGYIGYNGNDGGHVFNYFVLNNMYIMCDFRGPVELFTNKDPIYTANTQAYIVYIGDDLNGFGNEFMIGSMAVECYNNPDNSEYIYHLFAYSKEGVVLPKGSDQSSEQTKFDNVVWDIFPEQYKDQYTVLFEREGYPLRFMPIPDESTWPAEIR